MTKHRNIKHVVQHSLANYQRAEALLLMQAHILKRSGKVVTILDGREVIEFVNCSYLGLDLHPDVIAASKALENDFGVNFCCARTRFSIEKLYKLEQALASIFYGHVITFPSVTTAHMSVLPLLASGILIDDIHPPKIKLIFDKFAHSSMQYLKPILAEEAEVVTIEHNDLNRLYEEIMSAKKAGCMPIYIADGIYSMGGLCPIKEIIELSKNHDFYVYIDDAHGTSIFGETGGGTIIDQFGCLPDNVIMSVSLSKGYGCNGGAVVFPHKKQIDLVRYYGQIYAFSAALDFSVTNASLASLILHQNGTVRSLQRELKDRVLFFDSLIGKELPFSPIRMVHVGDELRAIDSCKRLLDLGFFTSVVFFPIVAKGNAQLRVCIAVNHSNEQIERLVEALRVLSLL